MVATTTHYVIALNASSGARLWSYNSGSGDTDYPPPAIANGVVYEGSLDGLQAFNEATGAVLYSHSMISFVGAIVSNGAVYMDDKGVVLAFGL